MKSSVVFSFATALAGQVGMIRTYDGFSNSLLPFHEGWRYESAHLSRHVVQDQKLLNADVQNMMA